MTAKTPEPTTSPTISFVDNPLAPDVYADEAIGFLAHNGTIRITLVSDRAAAPGPINRVVVGRLVMTVHGAQALAVGLFDFLKNQGLEPTALSFGEPKKANQQA